MKFRRFRRDSDLEDELRAHLDLQAEENAARGITGELPCDRHCRRRQIFERTPASSAHDLLPNHGSSGGRGRQSGLSHEFGHAQ